MAIDPNRPVVPVARAAQPAAAPAAPQPKQGAKARGDADYIDVSSPDAFKNTVVKWVGYVQDARGRLGVAKGKLDEARAAELARSRELEGPLAAARQALAKAEAPLQAALDARTDALAAARAALDDAVHPNKAQADALEAQARSVQQAIDGHEEAVSDLRRTIDRLDPGSSWYRSEAARLNREINDHQAEIDRLGRRRFELIQQANDARAVQRDPSDAGVAAARKRVADATDAVAAAQAALRDGTDPFLNRVDGAQQAYNHAMAASRAVVADAERGVSQADAEAKRVEATAREVGGKVGFFKRLKWRLVDHFDAKAFWAEKAGALGL